MNSRLPLKIHLLLFGAWPSLAFGQSIWTGADSTSWATATNWTGGVPASGANIAIADTTSNNTLSLASVDRTIGSLTHGNSGTRNTPLFSITTGASVLTIQGGVNASGPLTGGVMLSLNGNTTVSGNQTWTVGGDLGAVNVDRGMRLQADGTNKTVTLNGNITKEGSGTLLLANVTLGGAGDLVINGGGLKINAASSSLITVGGYGRHPDE